MAHAIHIFYRTRLSNANNCNKLAVFQFFAATIVVCYAID
jgi:hypothetical protein